MEASRSPGVMARGRGSREGSWETGGCTDHYHVTYPMMPLTLPPPLEQTYACENITFP